MKSIITFLKNKKQKSQLYKFNVYIDELTEKLKQSESLDQAYKTYHEILGVMNLANKLNLISGIEMNNMFMKFYLILDILETETQ